MRVRTLCGFPVSFVAALIGLNSTAVSGAEPSAKKRLVAGPFSVMAPAHWAATAVVEKVPIFPVYSPEGWDAFKKDPMLALKPTYGNRPEHWAIRFPTLVMADGEDAVRHTGGPTSPQILIHKSAEWEAVYQDGTTAGDTGRKAIAGLRRDLKIWAERDLIRGVPVAMDAHLDFICLKQKLRFNGGYGFRILAQWDVEPTLVTRGELHYLFFGMSDDNTCQIIATFPIDIPGLVAPRNEGAEHLGYSVSRYADLERDWENYEALAKQWITQNAAKAKPVLNDLDAMIESLVAKTWQP
jgi:hypothetical protein